MHDLIYQALSMPIPVCLLSSPYLQGISNAFHSADSAAQLTSGARLRVYCRNANREIEIQAESPAPRNFLGDVGQVGRFRLSSAGSDTVRGPL